MADRGDFAAVVKLANQAFTDGLYQKASEYYKLASESAQAIAIKAQNPSVRAEYLMKKKKCDAKVADCKNALSNKKSMSYGNGKQDTADDKDIEAMITKYDPESAVTFADVAGLDEVKNTVYDQVIKPLKFPDKAKRYNIEPGAMMMLYGLPGTGKTLIANAIAGEMKADFYDIRCQDLISKYVGSSSRNLQKLFDHAFKQERAIMFFDEFDSIGSKRSDSTDGADQEINRFMSTFLTNIGSVKKHKTNKMMLIITATNRPWAIDSAMLRGQRIDQQFYVQLPDEAARKFIIDKEFKSISRSNDFDEEEMIRLLKGYGCGDIVAICKTIRNKLFVRDCREDKIQKITAKDYRTVIRKQPKSYDIEEYKRFNEYYKMHKNDNEDED